MKKNFIFLNVFTTSVADEHNPRGPKGPYQFKYRSVPVCVIKQWDGKTLIGQLGFVNGKAAGMSRLKGWIDQAISKNGPIVKPRYLMPLRRYYDKGVYYLKKKKPADAHGQFTKAVEGGKNKKKFPAGPPQVCKDAATKIAEIMSTAADEIQSAKSTPDKKKAKRELNKLLSKYRRIAELKKQVQAALDALKE